MDCIKDELAWLGQHAERSAPGKPWKCKETGAEIQCRKIGRSIWLDSRIPGAGEGEVRTVGHLFCPVCDPDHSFPKYGHPIYEDELEEVA